MGRRDDLIEKYAEDLRTKCDVQPDMDLLRKVVIGLGPTIYRDDSETVASSDGDELRRIENNFLKRRLALPEGEHLMGGIQSVISVCGHSNRHKYRAVVYYLLVKHFKKEDAYA